MPHIGVINCSLLEHKRTIIVLNSSYSPVFLPSPAMRFNTGKDIFTSFYVLPLRLTSIRAPAPAIRFCSLSVTRSWSWLLLRVAPVKMLSCIFEPVKQNP